MAISRTHKAIRIFLAVFWLLVLTWQFYSMQARGFDEAILKSSENVNVLVRDDALIFSPALDTSTAALIFYPGALVDPRAYTPMARAIAEAGYKVAIMKLPFRLAPLARHKAEVAAQTIAFMKNEFTRYRWIVSGHSRGGALAAQFAHAHADLLAGLLLIGTSHPREEDLSQLRIEVTKIYASEDGLASEAEVKQFAALLPAHTHWVRIEGGNHAQFGWYGSQLGDDQATISREEQQRFMIAGVLEALKRVAAAK